MVIFYITKSYVTYATSFFVKTFSFNIRFLKGEFSERIFNVSCKIAFISSLYLVADQSPLNLGKVDPPNGITKTLAFSPWAASASLKASSKDV